MRKASLVRFLEFFFTTSCFTSAFDESRRFKNLRTPLWCRRVCWGISPTNGMVIFSKSLRERILVLFISINTMIPNGIRIETTRADYAAICRCLEENDIQCIVSENPTQYLCNAAYYYMLHKTDGKAVFIHIPSLKNMSEEMIENLVRCVEKINISY